jgi:hypothetical protein
MRDNPATMIELCQASTVEKYRRPAVFHPLKQNLCRTCVIYARPAEIGLKKSAAQAQRESGLIA